MGRQMEDLEGPFMVSLKEAAVERAVHRLDEAMTLESYRQGHLALLVAIRDLLTQFLNPSGADRPGEALMPMRQPSIRRPGADAAFGAGGLAAFDRMAAEDKANTPPPEKRRPGRPRKQK